MTVRPCFLPAGNTLCNCPRGTASAAGGAARLTRRPPRSVHRVVVEKASGDTFACKSIQKRLDIPNISADKQAQHIDNVEREIAILKRLRGTLR